MIYNAMDNKLHTLKKRLSAAASYSKNNNFFCPGVVKAVLLVPPGVKWSSKIQPRTLTSKGFAGKNASTPTSEKILLEKLLRGT